MKNILDPLNKYKYLKENENKFQKNPENSWKSWTAPKRIFETFALRKHQDASA
jgi:hypothetical protein